MTMTRKDFAAIADALLEMRPRDPAMMSQWTEDICAVAHACKAINPRFSHDRFYDASGVRDTVAMEAATAPSWGAAARAQRH